MPPIGEVQVTFPISGSRVQPQELPQPVSTAEKGGMTSDESTKGR
jgi:hypothetical protein